MNSVWPSLVLNHLYWDVLTKIIVTKFWNKSRTGEVALETLNHYTVCPFVGQLQGHSLLCFGQLHTVGSKFDIVDMLPLSVWLLTTVQMDKITLFLANYSQHVNSKLKVFKCQLVI